MAPRRGGDAIVFAAALALCACDQPPTKEIAAAERQIETARQAGAERYAPDRLKDGEAALVRAREKVAAKDYRAALSAASDAAERARGAVQAVGAAKTLARSAAQVAQAEVQVMLDEAAALQEKALAEKVPTEAFAELKPVVDELGEGLKVVSDHLGKGEVLEAQRRAAELKALAAGLPARFQEARTRWEAEHPKVRARTPRGRSPRKR